MDLAIHQEQKEKTLATKLGKGNVLGTQLFSYPNEYIVRVTLRKETPEALDIAHELRGIFLDNNLAVGIVTLEAQA